MQTVAKIIRKAGGLEPLMRGEAVSVSSPAGRLLIEYIGSGARGACIAVSQLSADGNECRLSMCFELLSETEWQPFVFREEASGNVTPYIIIEGKERLIGINCEVFRKMRSMAREWDLKLKEMDFLRGKRESLYFPLFPEG